MALVPDKAIRREIIADGTRAIGFAQRLWRLIQNERENAETIKNLKAEVATLKLNIRDLQAREEVLLEKAELAATRAAMQIVTNLALRLGRIEGGDKS